MLSTAVNNKVKVSRNVGLMAFRPYTMMVGMVPDCIQAPIITPMAIRMAMVGSTTFRASKAPWFTCL